MDAVQLFYEQELTTSICEDYDCNYRYGFNGIEKDDEIKSGRGNSYSTTFRQYDPRLGRWLSLDPVKHHHYTPYSAFDDNPIYYIDPSGADGEDVVKVSDDDTEELKKEDIS